MRDITDSRTSSRTRARNGQSGAAFLPPLKPLPVQHRLNLAATQHTRLRLGTGLYKLPAKTGTYSIASYGNYSERPSFAQVVHGA